MSESDLDHIRACPVGLLTEVINDQPGTVVQEALDYGHDFVMTAIAHSTVKRVLEPGYDEAYPAWRANPSLDRNDVILKSADHSEITAGVLADWLELDSPEDHVRLNSEMALKQELAWACHLGLIAVMLPRLPNSLENAARVVVNQVRTMSYTQFWIKVPVAAWQKWNRFRNLAEHSTKIHVALELAADHPDEGLLDLWLAEPIKAVIVPGDVFVSNAKGYPVLKKCHQTFVQKLMYKLRPNMIVSLPKEGTHLAATQSSYQEYIRHLNRELSPQNDVERFAQGYQDYLQAPLQPLMDNLDNNTYETFEKDPIKYQQYEEAVYRALLDRVKDGSDYQSVIMVVGAGRGPLVDCCLRAAERSERNIHVYALEKNPNAYVTLQNRKAEDWGDKVDLVFADMRRWTPTKKCDILVSELLGSFGDNELSPECLDGAQRLLKDDGISIPSKYTAYVAPLASNKLYNEVNAYKDLIHLETPYVVMFEQTCQLSEPKSLWSFEHPNKQLSDPPLDNLHNMRHKHVTFTATSTSTMHGLAGYFDAELYKDVNVSIHPKTHSPGMFSWFPIYFPLRSAVQIPQGATISVDIWRQTDPKKVWYEWSVSVSLNGVDTAILPIHNVGGRSYWVGL